MTLKEQIIKKAETGTVTQQPAQTAQERLTVLVPTFGKNKKELDTIKKVTDSENAEIKELMTTSNLSTFNAAGYVATISTTEKKSFNEDFLIEKLKALKIKGLIKKREYVDMDALENAIYKGAIDAASLADCEVVNTTITLRVKEQK